MKQKIALLFTALFLFGFAKAQVSKDSYEKVVDFLNCKTVELSLKEDKNLSDFQKKCPCGQSSFTQINQFLNSVKLDATIALSNEVEGLKNSFKENWKKEDVVSFLSESIFNDKTKFQKIFAFADKRQGKPEFVTYKANLSSELPNMLTENISQENISQISTSGQESSIEDRLAELEKQSQGKEGKGWLSGITSQIIVVSFLISMLFLLLSFFLFSRLFKNNDTEISTDIKNYIKRKIDDVSFNRNISNNNFNTSELKDIHSRIRDLELQIKNLSHKLQPSNLGSIPTPQTTYQEVKQPEVRTETFFLSTPNADGSFNESSALSVPNDAATIYKFLKIGNSRAKFLINEKDTSVKLALQYPDKSIDPVCDAINAFNPKSTKITTVEQGEAELQGNKWIVNKKAKIRYEN